MVIAVRAFKARLAMMTLPRVLLTPHLMGRPLGPPGDRKRQTQTIRAALSLLEKAEKAGAILDLPG